MVTIRNITCNEFESRMKRIIASLDKLKKHNKNKFIKKVLFQVLKSSDNKNREFLEQLYDNYFHVPIINQLRSKLLNYPIGARNIQCVLYFPYYYRMETRPSHHIDIDIEKYNHNLENFRNNTLANTCVREKIQVLCSPIVSDNNVKCCLLLNNCHLKAQGYHSLKWTERLSKFLSIYYSHQYFLRCFTKDRIETTTKLLHLTMKRDSDISGHCIRVGFYAGYIAERYGMDKNRVSDIEIAGALHDIGKLSVPQNVLNKTSSLTNEEYTLIKKHPEYTNRIIKNMKCLDHINEITLYHHERYDGAGYPAGLKGNEIPIESQIISLADAFDAMTSDRTYRKALPLSHAIQILLDESGKQFKPEIVNLAVRILPEIHNISYTL